MRPRTQGSRSGSVTSRRLVRDQPDWPEGWRALSDQPLAVFSAGDQRCLARRCLAIVGTRRATARGLAVATRLGAELVRLGWTIVSGLARGIDAAAHCGALEAGGPTVAVMATGLDQTYPHNHRALRLRVEASGCVVSEYGRGTPPLGFRFLQRNRLIAGLAEATIVVEAPRRSGALATARQANDLGREVLVVPGPVDCEQYVGSHHLIRDGATLIRGSEDVIMALGCPLVSAQAEPVSLPAALALPCPSSAARWIFDRLDLDGIQRDRLRERWPGNEATWAEGLLALEVAGLIRRLPGGRLARSIWL